MGGFGYGAEAFGTAAAQRESLNKSIQDQLRNRMTANAMPFQVPMLQQEMQAKQLGIEEAQTKAPYQKSIIEQALLSAMLGNKKSQAEIDYMPQQQQMDQQKIGIEQQNANTSQQGLTLKNALLALQGRRLEHEMNPRIDPLNAPGNAGQLTWADHIEKSGDPELAAQIRKAVKGSAGAPKYNQLPLNERMNYNAMARSWGISELEAANAFNENIELEALAREKGVSEDQIQNVIRTYLPTTATLTKNQTATGAGVVSNYISNLQSDWLEPYRSHGSFKGYSLKQIADTIKGSSDPQAFPKFLAAVKMNAEIAGERGRELGLDVGIEALKHLEESVPGNVRGIEEMASAKDLADARQLFNDQARYASALRTDSIQNPEKYNEERMSDLSQALKYREKYLKKESPRKKPLNTEEDPLGIFD